MRLFSWLPNNWLCSSMHLAQFTLAPLSVFLQTVEFLKIDFNSTLRVSDNMDDHSLFFHSILNTHNYRKSMQMFKLQNDETESIFKISHVYMIFFFATKLPVSDPVI